MTDLRFVIWGLPYFVRRDNNSNNNDSNDNCGLSAYHEPSFMLGLSMKNPF